MVPGPLPQAFHQAIHKPQILHGSNDQLTLLRHSIITIGLGEPRCCTDVPDSSLSLRVISTSFLPHHSCYYYFAADEVSLTRSKNRQITKHTLLSTLLPSSEHTDVPPQHVSWSHLSLLLGVPELTVIFTPLRRRL